MARFPFMEQAPDFPHGNTVNVWNQYQNTFDYSRWVAGVEITLCNVPWDADGENVVKFDSDSDRESWFKSIESETITLDTLARLNPNGAIRLPVPFDEVALYNYLRVDFGTATSTSNPIDYEHEHSVKVMHYFITDNQSVNSSVTEVTLKPDYWTTYINYATIPMMMLKRGHYPVSKSNVEDYLADPINNNTYLLTPDIGGGETVVKSAPLTWGYDSSERIIIFVTNCSWNSMAKATVQDSISPNFYDMDGYNGASAGVSMQVNYGSKNYRNAVVNAPNFEPSSASTASTLYYYGISASIAKDFINDMSANYTPYLMGVEAAYVCSMDYIKKGVELNFDGFTVFTVLPAYTYQPINLNKSMFDYPDDIADLTKLYTYPYAELEWTDQNGVYRRIKIENCKDLTACRLASLAYPWIGVDTFLAGVNGAGGSTFNIRALSGNNVTGTIYDGDYIDTLIKYDIPTFVININNANVSAALSTYDNQAWEYTAKASYTNSILGANTSYYNATQSNATAKTNADANADTGKSNADDNADTAKVNADANADTVKNNAYASADTSIKNTANSTAAATACTNTQNAASKAVTARNVSAATDSTNTSNLISDVATTGANNTCQLVNAENQKASTLTTQANGMASLAQGAVGLGASLATGNLIGAAGSVAGMIGTGINQALATQTNAIAFSAQDSIVNNTVVQNNTNQANTKFQNSTITNITNNASTDNTNTSASASSSITATQNNAATANTSNNAATTKTNASRTQATTKANASRTQATTKANASRTQATTKVNAARTKQVADANAQRSDTLTVNQQQRSLRAAYNARMSAWYSERLKQPQQVGTYSGDGFAPAENRNAVQLRVRTMPMGQIRPIADYFKRYGYAWIGQVSFETINDLKCMKSFSYWEASEVWVTGDTLIEDARNQIQNILKNGTTVWNSPEMIGSVNLNANL